MLDESLPLWEGDVLAGPLALLLGERRKARSDETLFPGRRVFLVEEFDETAALGRRNLQSPESELGFGEPALQEFFLFLVEIPFPHHFGIGDARRVVGPGKEYRMVVAALFDSVHPHFVEVRAFAVHAVRRGFDDHDGIAVIRNCRQDGSEDFALTFIVRRFGEMEPGEREAASRGIFPRGNDLHESVGSLMRESDFAFHVAETEELRLFRKTLGDGEKGFRGFELMRSDEEVRGGHGAAMREAESFGPRRDTDAARLIDNDSYRLSFGLLFSSNGVDFLLVEI